MRLVFQGEKQKELIEKEKKLRDLTWNEFSEELGLKYGKLHAYHYEESCITEELFEKLFLKEEYKKFILEKKDENWGMKLGGKNSKGRYFKKIKCPENSEELAEFYGIMLGDGNSTKKQDYKVGTYQIRIAGDSRNDLTYITYFVKPLVEKLFDVKANILKMKDSNCIQLSAAGIKLVEFLESKGFKPGNKIKNQLDIPPWIRNNTEYLKACIRGLYDTDGSVYKLPNQNVFQFSFRNYNFTLINRVRDSLISLGIIPSRITKGNEIFITKKSELRKFLNEVGFRNSRHLNKVKMWNLSSPIV